ncbi:PREDICTED: uncharacterized protein LOC104600638 [Nelumbo nucifera]|uniref:Uncharacterized protein LOC104600638 n=1 Tax=Nelumbo nucifera TaxID=4432 RepID=A0A1U8AIM7_NELNU|nr:PREDICTED: uncharacterized protein LOC104600638 [Nelumbo nucifera]
MQLDFLIQKDTDWLGANGLLVKFAIIHLISLPYPLLLLIYAKYSLETIPKRLEGDHWIEDIMYVTRPLSLYRQTPSSLSLPPPEGPNSGYIVIQDEESVDTCCFGLCKDYKFRDLPFPQNKMLTVRYGTGAGENRWESHDDAYFIPVLNQPLSSNLYYVIKAHRRHKGEAYRSSTQEDMATCCFCRCVSDVKPKALDHQDIYQQFEIKPWQGFCGPSRGGFTAKPVAPDGIPPQFLRRKGWEIYASTPKHYQLGEAQGLDASLRAHLPDLDFTPETKISRTVVVGKWYSPFMFIKEGDNLKDQMKRSMFYEVTLEQQWEQIYACENTLSESNTVAIDVYVQKEVVLISGTVVAQNDTNVVDGVIWFRAPESPEGELSVGLSLVVAERMRWEQERVGWNGGKDRQVRVERVEEFGGEKSRWRKFGCYVLVERFVFKRMDGSILLSYEFRHTHQIQSKWD